MSHYASVIASVIAEVNNSIPGIMFPYNKARLVKPSQKSKDQRWLIKFYVWDASINAKVMKRDYSCNQIKDPTDREIWCKQQIASLNKSLAEGYHINAVLAEKKDQEQKIAHQKQFIRLIEGVNKALAPKLKLRPKTYENHALYTRHFISWLEANGHHNMFLRNFTEEIAEQFCTWLMVGEKHLAPRTHNNYLETLRGLFKWLMDKKYIDSNPFLSINYLEPGEGKNLAYTRDQQNTILRFAEDSFPEIVPLIYTMYSTFLRTNEISLLKVGQIGMYNPDEIYLPKEDAKNGRERHVMITPTLQSYLDRLHLHKYPSDYYVFGFPNLTPSPTYYPGAVVASRYERRILRLLKLNGMDYTLYSWKHSGVVAAKRAGLADASIILQGGWKDIASYQKYLRSLGLEGNSEFSKQFPDLKLSDDLQISGLKRA
ncbi:MAG: tyrosine-type recombinase/integrase [Bacteroidia bacterium]